MASASQQASGIQQTPTAAPTVLRLEWYLNPSAAVQPKSPVSFQDPVKLARDSEGCRVFQNTIEDATSDEAREALAAGLRGHVWELVQCPHGNHVLQKYIMTMNSSACRFIIEELTVRGLPGLSRVARDRYGCRILQRIMEHVQHPQLVDMLDFLVKDGVVLSTHRYGTYVMQHLLEHGSDAHRRHLIRDLAAHAELVSVNNDACMVLESAFAHGPQESQELLLTALLKTGSAIAAMAHMRRGHPVVLAMLQLLGSDELSEGRRQLEGQATSLSGNRYGRLVLNLLRQRCGTCSAACAGGA